MYVEMKDICKNYGDFRASDHVSFGIEKGKLVALLGPSGSGKTTLLRMIAGLETPNSGDIYIDGQRVNDVPAAKRGIGFVFQNYALFRYMTVYDNVAFGLELMKMPKKEIKKRVTELLELTGLSGMEKRYPNQLSGGQRQRVAFARALAPNPQVLLLDEPFAAIDAKVRTELRTWLKEMVTKLGITSIFVTHDQDEAVEVADEIIITNHGRIEQLGTPMEIYKSPDTPFVAQFIGAMSVNFGVPMDKIVEVLKIFQAVEHRIEYVTEKRGVKFYNDSKGTNPDAAIQGIRAMNRPTFLIGGGYDKQSEYDEWIEAFDGKVKKLVLIGQTAEKIENCAHRHGFMDTVRKDTFEEAIQYCYDNAKSGDAVLLSPACASWGMFPNYEERGRIFKEYVRNLEE